jgi:hypothetical protein
MSEKIYDRGDWFKICVVERKPLPEEYVEQHKDVVNWDWVSSCQEWSEEFISKYADRITWHIILECQNISENLILNNLEYIDLFYLENNENVPKELFEKVKIMKELAG